MVQLLNTNQKSNQNFDFYEATYENEPDAVVEKIYAKYNDDVLVEWEFAPQTPKNESEPGHLGTAYVNSKWALI